jgi:acetoin utilization deacetylase AcuC-like enzyme
MIQLAYSDRYTLALPDGHRFPIAKYGLVYEQLRYEGLASDANFFDPGLCDEADVLHIHTPAYYARVRDQQLAPAEVRRLGLPLVFKCEGSFCRDHHANRQLYLASLLVRACGTTSSCISSPNLVNTSIEPSSKIPLALNSNSLSLTDWAMPL